MGHSLVVRRVYAAPLLALGALHCGGSGASTASRGEAGTHSAPSSAGTGGSSALGGMPGGGTGATTASGGMASAGASAASGAAGSGAGGTNAGGVGASDTGGGGASAGAPTGGGMSNSGNAGTASDPGVAPSAIEGLKIEDNPNSVLSAFVSWKTNVAASSVVRFGIAGHQWELADDQLVTEHRVLVIGMKEKRTYDVRAISTNGGGSVQGDTTYTTQSLPAVVPKADITEHDTARSQPGWTLMNVQKGDGTPGALATAPAMAVMFDDEDGAPVWYYIDGTSLDQGGATSVDLTDRGVLIGPTFEPQDSAKGLGEPPREVDFAGNVLFDCGRRCGLPGALSHHAGKLDDGNYIVIQDLAEGSRSTPLFVVLSPEKKVIKSFKYSDLVTPSSSATGDWCHGNSATVDLADDAIYLNCRWMGLVKATYSTGAFQWFLAGTYGGATGDFTFSSGTASRFSDTHDPEIHSDGTILFFDNGGWDTSKMEGNPKGYQSRAVEYKVDPEKKTAELVWEFPGTFEVDAWYTTLFYLPFWGDADRLANGNVLITAGIRGPNSRGHVFEVGKADGVIVWELQLPVDYGVYRSERIVPPLLRPLADGSG